MYQSNWKAIGVCDMLGSPGGLVIRPNKHRYTPRYTVDKTFAERDIDVDVGRWS